MADAMDKIGENLHAVEERIGCACALAGRSRQEVILLAVTKKRPMEQLSALKRLGVHQFGENRVQEVRDRIPTFEGGVIWHFVGHLQKNKAKYLPGLVQWVHSVDRPEVAEALQKAWSRQPDLPPVKVLLQFNISGEEQKHGAGRDEALDLLRAALACDRLDVAGLMTMAPYSDDPETSRPIFRALRNLRDRLQAASGHPLPHLSMGMTGDFEVAIEEGATIVRIGTALFE